VALDLNDVAVFAEVAAAGSFKQAALALDLPASTVSRRVARLEDALGFKLLHRTTRSVGLTDSGRSFYERTANLARMVEDAARSSAASHDTPTGFLRVTAPPDDSGVIWALLEGFVRAHPAIDLEIVHTLEFYDLIDKGIDVALRGAGRPTRRSSPRASSSTPASCWPRAPTTSPSAARPSASRTSRTTTASAWTPGPPTPSGAWTATEGPSGSTCATASAPTASTPPDARPSRASASRRCCS
jgi:DNA-binding transcriptional LysR family regulator